MKIKQECKNNPRSSIKPESAPDPNLIYEHPLKHDVIGVTNKFITILWAKISWYYKYLDTYYMKKVWGQARVSFDEMKIKLVWQNLSQ